MWTAMFNWQECTLVSVVDLHVRIQGLNIYTDAIVISRTIAIHDIIDNLPIFDCGTIKQVYISTEAVIIRTTPSNDLR